MDKLTFAIDCDEVLRSLLKNMVGLYNKEFDDNLDVNDIKDFVVENSFPKIEELTGTTAAHWFFQEHSEDLFRFSDAFPQIKEDIDILKHYGEVIIVTYQKSYKNKMDTLQWLEEHGIAPDGICFLKNKTLLHCDVMIDDNDWNFIGCNAKHGVLIDAPYNMDTDLNELIKKSNCETMRRCKSLHEFVESYCLPIKNE